MSALPSPPEAWDASWLAQDLAAHGQPSTLESDDERLTTMADLVQRGEYIRAAERAAALYAEGVLDIRSLGYYLLGVFLVRGLSALPEIFRGIIHCLDDDIAAFGPAGNKPMLADGVLLWFFSGALKHAEFIEQQREAAWDAWLRKENLEPVLTARQLLSELAPALSRLGKKNRALDRLRRFDGWLDRIQTPLQAAAAKAEEEARQAAAASPPRPPPPAAPPPADDSAAARKTDKPRPQGKAPDPDPAAESSAALEDDDEELGRDREDSWGADATAALDMSLPEATPGLRPRRPEPRGASVQGSAAWTALLHRLAAFQELIQKEAYLHAAVVSADLQQTLASFDPKLYFPSVFSPYLLTLSDHIGDLEEPLSDSSSLKFRTLSQLYQADLESFLRSAGRAASQPRRSASEDDDD